MKNSREVIEALTLSFVCGVGFTLGVLTLIGLLQTFVKAMEWFS
ncbi:hypothetical protein [Moraxella bovoculi]|nr:hypothetical protein [Moraxella bovoculi]